MWQKRRVHTISFLFLALNLLLSPCTVQAQESSSWVLRPGLRIGTPERLAVGGGLLMVQSSGIDHFTSLGLFAEGGVAGARVGMGVATTSPGPSGFQLRTSIMRTWAEPWGVAPNQTFVGAEIRLTMLVTLSAGSYWRLQGNAPGDARHISLGVGLGI